MTKTRVVVWFSCGATSAVAAKLAVKKYAGRDLHICYCDTRSEHPDNMRFLKDVEKWLGLPIEILYSEKYHDIWDVFEKTRYLAGIHGARCTTELKKLVRRKYQRDDDIQVFGFDSSEATRVVKFQANNPEVILDPILQAENLSKPDCLSMLKQQGIKPPITYAMGYKNANCIGCVKGQSGYWNKIRVDFPDVFARMAKIERKLNVALNKKYIKGKRIRVFLDELDPKAGRYKTEPDIACSLWCGEVSERLK